MKCLVLGGAGFIGSHVVDALVARGHSVRVFDLPNVSTANLRLSLGSIEFINGDFENISDVAPLLEGIDVMFHLVGTTLPGPSNANPAYDVETNVVGTVKLFEQALEHGVKKIVYASSGGTVYGIPEHLPIPESHPTDPLCSYGITKLATEKYLALFHHLHGLDYVILRFANPYGPRQRTKSVQGAVAVFLGHIFKCEEITIWGDGTIERDYLYISDLVAACAQVIESDVPSNLYNIGSGRSVSLNGILSVIEEVTGIKPKVSYVKPRKLDVPVNCLDIARARNELSWSPQVSLKDGIAKTWEWLTQK